MPINPFISISRDRQKISDVSHNPRVFVHATKTLRAGIAAAKGWVLLLLFLPIKKSKRKKEINVGSTECA
jgi:hypothetical protein